MADYTYTGENAVDYLEGSIHVTVEAGDVVSLDEAPSSPDFEPVKASKPDPKPATVPAVDGSDLTPEETQ